MAGELVARLMGEPPESWGYSTRGSRELARRSERLDIEGQLAVLKMHLVDNAVVVATTTEMRTQLVRKAAEMQAPDGGEAYAVYALAGLSAKAAVITDLGRCRA